MLGKKIVGKNCEKLFLYSHEYRDQKMGGTKRAKQFFQKHTNSASKKCLGKNRQKREKNGFVNSHKYRYQKMGGKNARHNFSRNRRIVRAKNVWEKIVGKK